MKIRMECDKDIYVAIYEDDVKLFGQGKTKTEAFNKLKRAVMDFAKYVSNKCEIKKRELEL